VPFSCPYVEIMFASVDELKNASYSTLRCSQNMYVSEEEVVVSLSVVDI
jgi:hypothetical protein